MGGLSDGLINDLCFLCGCVTNLRCPHCGVPVCGDTHYQYHRPPGASASPLVSAASDLTPDGDGQCQPYRLVTSDSRGRYLVATRPIRALDLVMTDAPVTIGPPAVTTPVCLECLVPLRPGHVSTCPQCRMPLCDTCATCPELPLHAAECDLIRNSSESLDIGDNLDQSHILYAAVMPLRMWRTRERDPVTWEKINFLQEESPEIQSESGQTIWREVAKFINETLGITDLTLEEISRLSGIKAVNACSLSQCSIEGAALYPLYPLMNSYCYCNTMYTIHPETKVMEVRAQRNIARGEEISTRYILPSLEQPARLETIHQAWGFICTCARCESPSELGSGYSSLVCGQCGGSVTLASPGVLNSAWECDKCGELSTRGEVGAVLAGCRDIMAEAEEVESLEKVLVSLQERLHPNHGFCIEIKNKLISTYAGRANKTREELGRQLQLVEEVLEVIDIIDPGMTPKRGGLLKHLVDLKMKTANLDVESGDIDKKTHLAAMRGSMLMMREIMKCLKFSSL